MINNFTLKITTEYLRRCAKALLKNKFNDDLYVTQTYPDNYKVTVKLIGKSTLSQMFSPKINITITHNDVIIATKCFSCDYIKLAINVEQTLCKTYSLKKATDSTNISVTIITERKKKQLHIICSNIDWDTDEMSAENLGLPDTVTIEPKDITEDMIDDLNGDYNDSITDYLSDKYGYCINSLNVDEDIR